MYHQKFLIVVLKLSIIFDNLKKDLLCKGINEFYITILHDVILNGKWTALVIFLTIQSAFTLHVTFTHSHIMFKSETSKCLVHKNY